MTDIDHVATEENPKSPSVLIGKILEASSLVLQDDTPCLSDYDDDTTDAKCVWNFEGPDGFAAELVFRLPDCAYDSRFFFDGKIVEGSETLDQYLVQRLPEEHLALVTKWVEAYRHGGIDQAWLADADSAHQREDDHPSVQL